MKLKLESENYLLVAIKFLDSTLLSKLIVTECDDLFKVFLKRLSPDFNTKEINKNAYSIQCYYEAIHPTTSEVEQIMACIEERLNLLVEDREDYIVEFTFTHKFTK